MCSQTHEVSGRDGSSWSERPVANGREAVERGDRKGILQQDSMENSPDASTSDKEPSLWRWTEIVPTSCSRAAELLAAAFHSENTKCSRNEYHSILKKLK